MNGPLGTRLLLLVGPTVPLPAGPDLARALVRTEVTNDAESGDGFQLTFALTKRGPEYDLLLGGRLDPPARVVLAVQAGAVPEVLIDGVITHHQLAPSDEPGQSTLTVTGKDVSAVMDLAERNESYPNQPDSLIVARVVARYAAYGLVPRATPTTDVPLETDRIPRQQETDLKFLQRLAQRNGFVFYVEPQAIGVNVACWGPEVRGGLPQPALTLGMGAAGNLRSLSFAKDGLAAAATEGRVVEPLSKLALPIPRIPPLRVPPLALSPAPALRTMILRDAAGRSPGGAATAAAAAAARGPDPVTGEGEVDAARYGRVLRARRLVAVRGAGLAYDGLYYVRRVTHTLAPGEYIQKFAISREGTRTTVPAVPT